LGQLASKVYEAAVEDLLNPGTIAGVEEDVWKRYYVELSYHDSLPMHMGRWLCMALFWHH
jgi:hypothetical protein